MLVFFFGVSNGHCNIDMFLLAYMLLTSSSTGSSRRRISTDPGKRKLLDVVIIDIDPLEAINSPVKLKLT
jgi:hypothetical protein